MYPTSHRYNLLGNLYGAHGEKEIMPKLIFGNGTELSFESNIFNVPEHYHEYLQRLYGEYNELPPEIDRVGHTKHFQNYYNAF